MVEKAVIIHEEVLKKGLDSDSLTTQRRAEITRAIDRINTISMSIPPDRLIRLQMTPPGDMEAFAQSFLRLPDLVGHGNSALLLGIKKSVCGAIAESHLKERGIPFRRDPIGYID